MTFESDIKPDDVVFLITDLEQRDRIVTAVKFITGGSVQYYVACAAEESYHFRSEITLERDLTKALGLSVDKQ